MGRLHLLPGEREELRLRPAALSRLPDYAVALAPAAGAGLLWLATLAPSWRPPAADAPWLHQIYGTPFAVALYALVVLAAAGAAHLLLRRKAWGLLAAVGAMLWLAAGVVAFPDVSAETRIPVQLACLSVPALAWVETVRRTTRYAVTNLRLVVQVALPRAAQGAFLHEDLVDVDGRRGLGDTGTITAVRRGTEAPRELHLAGVRPYKRVLAAVELLVQKATQSEALRRQAGIDRRVGEALAALQRH
ncbi:MAG: hypothetical protein QOD77_1739 [Thermoplasmata archaeon]|jgi:hypothetical protein|nr:hypothetical protein [Thermoplasmata archaeon]